ncbi:tubulin glycylase 3A-like [Anoplophora glabripennis]|uniref:tubulin glycylase 3A-like n=1 Tax=Anoplophora glabripennis TaxID=217634 RepID=UPI0008737BFE|nr:tubulin glycylase 3A-like [Anoplophora glabripennis]
MKADEENTEEKINEKDKPKNLEVTSLVSSAPSSSKIRTVTAEIQETINKCTKRSNSYIENKYKCTITSERLAQLRKIVENATRDHKVFSIKGGWPVIRRELLKRNWLEKIEHAGKIKYSNLDEVTSNLPKKQEWESTQSYVEKCEKTVMSRMLQNYDVDFYWSMRKDQSDLQHRGNAFKLINRFSRSLFASKEGLALLLQQAYWYTEAGVSSINFPRVYLLGFPDHYNLFVDDFRMSACMGLLKWFVEKYEKGSKRDIQSPEGKVPFSALQFAIDRCTDYIAIQKHIDIDKDFPRIWDHEWEQFLSNYYLIVHGNELFIEFTEPIQSAYAKSKSSLKDMSKYWPQYDIDGMKNIWILKPGNKCRGRGIQLVKNISSVDKVMGQKLKYVVQKYIEKPLIIYQTKFDIRQWFMVTNVQPLTIWMYRDCYLRFSSQMFDLNNFHESLHLTNHAVQCKYTNMQQRDKALPDDNMWDCQMFKAYLKKIGCMEKWDNVIYPGMQQSIICAMLASQDTMDRRQNTFEIYGADFMVSEDFRPWLIEINCSPDLSFSTKVTSRLCSQCMEDIIKVVIDRRRDPTANTGLFELVYKQNFPRTPPYLGMNLSVRGRKIFRSKSKIKSEKEKEKEKEKTLVRLRKPDFLSAVVNKSVLPNLISSSSYRGPVIEDFIQELHKSANDKEGIEFVPPMKINDKIKTAGSKPERQNAKENNKKEASINNYIDLFSEWSLKSKIPCDITKHPCEDLWEKETPRKTVLMVFETVKQIRQVYERKLTKHWRILRNLREHFTATEEAFTEIPLNMSTVKNGETFGSIGCDQLQMPLRNV